MPDVTDQVNGEVPPASVTVAEYAIPVDAFGKTVVVIVSDTAIVSVRSCVAFAPALSST